MKLSVIILNWNGMEILRKFLPSVVANTVDPEIEVVVADNGSTDGSPSWVEEKFPQVRLILLDRNYGYAEGYNRAIAAVDSPYVVLLNSDVSVGEGWWRPLLTFMEGHPDAGAAQPKILSYREPGKFEYAGAAGGLLDRLGYPYCRGRVLERVEADSGQYDGEAVDVAWASGAALMVSREAYEKVGGLDPRFFAHMEEIDLCCRMWGAGYRVCVVPDSKVWHLGGGSLNYGNPQKTYLNFRNNLLLLHKNLPRKRGRSVLLRRRLVDTLAFAMFVAKGEWADAKAVLRAHRDFRRMRGEYTDFPQKDTLRDLPGADKYLFLLKLKKR